MEREGQVTGASRMELSLLKKSLLSTWITSKERYSLWSVIAAILAAGWSSVQENWMRLVYHPVATIPENKVSSSRCTAHVKASNRLLG